MMPSYMVDVGCTVHAYARVAIDAKNRTDLVAKLREFVAERAGDEPFEVEWGGAEDYRIVHVEDANGQEVLTPECLISISDGE